MATVKGPVLPKIGKAFNVGNVTDGDQSRHIGKLRRYIIDNPRDEGLKRRETLWDFQQRNRGAALVRVKVDTNSKDTTHDSGEDPKSHTPEHESKKTHDKSNNVDKGKSLKALHFQKLKRKQRFESRVLGTSTVDLPEVRKDPSVTYSTALRIGSNIYNQMKGMDQSASSTLNTVYSEDVKKAIVRSIDKLPDLSASLTKLGYLKVARNGVRYGGGFYGRHYDRTYTNIKRSWSSLTPPVVQERIHGRIVVPTTAPVENKIEKTPTFIKKRLEYIDTLSIQQSSSYKTSVSSREDEWGSVSTSDSSSKKTVKSLLSKSSHQTYSDDKHSIPILEHARKRERRLRKLRDQQCTRVFAPMITKQNLGEKRDRIEKKLFIEAEDSRQRKLSVIRRERSKAKSDLEQLKRQASEQGLNLPKDKYGPTTQGKEAKRPSTYGVNPYSWTSKTSLSLDDKSWVKRTMQQTDVVDHSVYNSYARSKPPALQKASTELSLDNRKRSGGAKKSDS